MICRVVIKSIYGPSVFHGLEEKILGKLLDFYNILIKSWNPGEIAQ